MGKLNKRVVTTRRERILYSTLGFIFGIVMFVAAYYYFPMGRGIIHNRFVFRLGGVGLFFAVLSVWALVRELSK
jgi:hypothetical protein